jgi:hypothetical protein
VVEVVAAKSPGLRLPHAGQLMLHVTDLLMLPVPFTVAVNCACVPMPTVPVVELLLHEAWVETVVHASVIEVICGWLKVAVTVVLAFMVAVQLLGVPVTGVHPVHETNE